MIRRLLLALLIALPLPTFAADKNQEVFVKLTPIAVEFWDEAGIFHILNMDLSVVFMGEGKVDKTVAVQIQRALSAMSWEEFSRGNPAATVKALALDIVRKQAGSEKALDVLVSKMMTR